MQAVYHNAIGERTPVGVRLAAPPASIPEHWMMCKNVQLFQTAVNGRSMDDHLHMKKGVERGDGSMVDGQWLVTSMVFFGYQNGIRMT